MPDGFKFDFSELDRLAASLEEAPKKSGPFIRKAVEVTARNIKDEWAKSTAGLAHAKAFPRSIGYDVTGFQGFGSTVIQAEIGPDKNKTQGALGNLLEFGSTNNSPRGDGHAALQRNESDFQRGLEKAVDDGMKAAGL